MTATSPYLNHPVRSEREAQLEAENHALRLIINQCAKALGNGTVISSEASIEFMKLLPQEIRLHVGRLSREANARLIAAAPDLYEAAQELVAAMHRYEGWAEADAPIEHLEMMARAYAAIAKADGPAAAQRDKEGAA